MTEIISKPFDWNDNFSKIAQEDFSMIQKKQYLKQYAERIKPRKGRKVWELERTVEGYTRIRKVRL